MSNPVISVILPAYNVASYIAEAINSVINQTFTDCIEIIIVDDCGTDNSFEIAKAIGKSHHSNNRQFLFISNGCNKGLAAARNLGLRNASGEYIFFLDSDDLLEPRCFEELIKAFKLHAVDFVEGSTLHFYDDNTKRNEPKIHDNTLLTGADIFEGLSKKWMPVLWNKLFRRTFLISNNLYCQEGFFYEDLYWTFSALPFISNIQTISIPTYRYRIRNTSISHSLTDRHVKSFIRLIHEMRDFAESKNLKQHKYSDRIAYIYESVRCMAIDYVYSMGTKEMLKDLFLGLKTTNLYSISSIITNRRISIKMKCKVLSLYVGRFSEWFYTHKHK